MNRVLATKRNIIMGTINTMTNTLLPFILRTVMIHSLGEQYLGLNGLFASILQVLSLADMGFGSAIVSSMYKPVANNEIDKLCGLLNAYRKIYRRIGGVILVAGAVTAPFIGFFIEGTYPNNINIYIVFMVFVVNTAVSYWFGAYKQSILSAYQRIDKISMYAVATNIVLYTIQIVCLFLFTNYYLYIVWIPIASIIKNILLGRLVDKEFSNVRCYGYILDEEKESLKKKVLGLMISRICDVCRNSFDSIILSMYLGLVILADYQNYYTIMIAVASMIHVICASIIPSVGNSLVKESIEKNLADFNKFCFLYMKIAGICTAVLVCMYQTFIIIWLGEEYLLSNLCVITFGIYFYVLKIGDVCFVYKEALGMWWLDKKRCVLESVVNLLLNIILVRYIGVFGVLLSTIIAVLFVSIPWSIRILYDNYFKRSSKSYYVSQFWYAFDTAITTLIVCTVGSFIDMGGLLGVFIKFLLSSVTAVVVMFIISRRRKEYILAKVFMIDYIKRRGKINVE